MPNNNLAPSAGNVLKREYNPVQLAETFGRMRVAGELQKQKRQQELALKNESELERLFPIKVKEVIATHKEDLVKRLTETREHAEQLSVKYDGIDKVPPLERMKLNSEWANVNIDMDNSSKLLALTNKLTDVINTNPKVNKQKSITNLMGLLDMPLKDMAENSPDFANKVANVIEFNKTPEDWLKEGAEYHKAFPPVNYEDAETYGHRPDEKGARSMSDIKFNEKTPEGEQRRSVFGTADNYFNSLVKPALSQGVTKYKSNRSGSGSRGSESKLWEDSGEGATIPIKSGGVTTNYPLKDAQEYKGSKALNINGSEFHNTDDEVSTDKKNPTFDPGKNYTAKIIRRGNLDIKRNGKWQSVPIAYVQVTDNRSVKVNEKGITMPYKYNGYIEWKPQYDARLGVGTNTTTKQTQTKYKKGWAE